VSRALVWWVALWLALASPVASATETPIPPPPTSFVTDESGLLSPEARGELDRKLEAYEAQTGHQVIAYVGESTGGAPLETWAARAFERWRVGRKGLDDGAALFLFTKDRKVRIEVGYGLEDRIPDAIASRIIRERIVPRMQAGDPDGAVRDGIDGMLLAIEGNAVAPTPGVERPTPREIGLGRIIVGVVILLVLLALFATHPELAMYFLFTILSGRGRGRGGGSGGGGFGRGGFSGGGGRSGGGGASGSW
jgi:uncharacterized protein